MNQRRGKMSRYKRRVNVSAMELDEMVETVSVSARVNVIALAKWVHLGEEKECPFRSVSQAIGSALTTLIELLEIQGIMPKGDVRLEEAWRFLDDIGLVQRQMQQGRARGLKKNLVLQALLSSDHDHGVDVANTMHRSLAQMHRMHKPVNILAESDPMQQIYNAIPGLRPNKKVKMPDHDYLKLWSQEERDAMRAKFKLLPDEVKYKIGDDRQVQSFPEGLFITPSEETKQWYHEEFEACDDSLEWSDRVQTFAFFATSMLKTWKALEAVKDYTDENGVINPPDVYFKEQAQVLAEHERFKEEQAAIRAEQEKQAEMEKSKVKADKEIEKLKKKMEEAEKKAREMQSALRGSGGMPVV